TALPEAGHTNARSIHLWKRGEKIDGRGYLLDFDADQVMSYLEAETEQPITIISPRLAERPAFNEERGENHVARKPGRRANWPGGGKRAVNPAISAAESAASAMAMTAGNGQARSAPRAVHIHGQAFPHNLRWRWLSLAPSGAIRQGKRCR